MFQTSVICPVRLARGLAAARRGCIDHGVQRAYEAFEHSERQRQRLRRRRGPSLGR